MNTRFDRSYALLFSVIGLAGLSAVGCGDDSKGSDKPADTAANYEPTTAGAKSDGTKAGDLVALEIRQTELVCACAGAQTQACMDLTWPEGRDDCARDAYQADAASKETALTCAEKATKTSIDCLGDAACDGDAQDKCLDAFYDEQERCLGDELFFEALACLGGEDATAGSGGGSSTVDEDEWCAEADICDGFEDCADGSDEAGCEEN